MRTTSFPESDVADLMSRSTTMLSNEGSLRRILSRNSVEVSRYTKGGIQTPAATRLQRHALPDKERGHGVGWAW